MRTFTRIKQELRTAIPFLAVVQRYAYRFKSYEAKFRAYYLDNGWGDSESVSGPGSTLEATRVLRRELPLLFKRFQIESVMDLPCGDFNWMKEVDLDGIRYEGCDIVPELIEANRVKYEDENIMFQTMDLIDDNLPRVDLIICRDCLFHYPSAKIHVAIRNMKKSGARFLLTTTFRSLEVNSELETIGLFRPINLELAPYGFPEPRMVIAEGTADKSLALWDLKDL